MRRAFIWMTMGSLGCKAVDPAPEDFDALMHFMWQKADTGTDSELLDGVTKLHAAIDGANLLETVDGTLSRLSLEEVEWTGNGGDPTKASGVYLLNPFQCSDETLTELILHLDQQLLYPGVYDFYEREYTTSREAFLARETHELSWTLDYGATVLGSSYTATTNTVFRRLPGDDPEVGWSHGDVLFWKVHLPAPADFGNSGKSLDQDYQIDMYYPFEDRIIHAYAIWREGSYGAGFTTESEAVQRITLNNLADWDRETETLCLEGVPQ